MPMFYTLGKTGIIIHHLYLFKKIHFKIVKTDLVSGYKINRKESA